MSRASRQSTTGLMVRHLAAGRATSVLLAVLIGIAVLVTALIPRAVAALAQTELRHELTELSPLRTDLTAIGQLGPQNTGGKPTSGEEVFADLESSLESLPGTLGAPLSGILGPPEWIAQFPNNDARPLVERTNSVKKLTLAVGLRWEERVRFVEGAAPAAWTGSTADLLEPATRSPMEMAISADTARQMGLRVGDLVDYPTAPLLVSGIYEPVDEGDSYWLHASELLKPSIIPAPTGIIVSASVYVNAVTTVGMSADVYTAALRVWYPAILEKIEYADAAELLVETQQLTALGAVTSNGQQLVFHSSLTDAIDAVVARITSITALLALTGSAPLGVVIAVLALGVRAVLERRRSALALLAARGGTGLVLRSTMLLEGVIIALPISAVALAITLLLAPARLGPESLLVPIVVAFATPVLFAGITSSRLVGAGRADLSPKARRRSRWILEAIVLGLAALALFLLVRRGLVTTSASLGLDPLLAATPLLLALATCVVVLRVYPLPLLALQRTLRRRRGAVGMFGAARAVREPFGGFAGALATVVAVSAAVFSLVLSTTVAAGLAATAQASVGADIRVQAPSLGPALVDEIQALPGVRDAVAYDLAPGVELAEGFSGMSVDAVFADLDALDRVRPDLHVASTVEGDAIPFFASPDIAKRMDDTATQIAGQDAVRVGVVPLAALPHTTRGWILLDERYAAQVLDGADVAPTIMLVNTQSETDVAAVGAAVRETVLAGHSEDEQGFIDVTDSSALLAVATSRPSTAGLSVALMIAAGLALALGVLAIVLSTIAGTGARNRMIGVLRMLGMTPRQVRGLVAWELAPVAIAAVVAGSALGVGLSFIVTALLDLRPFVGGTAAVPLTVHGPLVAAVAIGFGLVVVVAGFVAVATARRISPAVTVKMGSE